MPSDTLDLAQLAAAIASNDQAGRTPDTPTHTLDALVLAIAAAVRVGERRLHRPATEDGNSTTPNAEVMDAEDVAAFLGVDRKTVYDYAARGEIPCRRLGKRLLFSRSALVAWLSSCKVVSRVNGA